MRQSLSDELYTYWDFPQDVNILQWDQKELGNGDVLYVCTYKCVGHGGFGAGSNSKCLLALHRWSLLS